MNELNNIFKNELEEILPTEEEYLIIENIVKELTKLLDSKAKKLNTLSGTHIGLKHMSSQGKKCLALFFILLMVG